MSLKQSSVVSREATATNSVLLDRIIGAAIMVFVIGSIWAAIAPVHSGPQVISQILLIASMAVLLVGHMIKHLGPVLLIAFIGTAAVMEWAFEQTNISNGGFIWGDLRYGASAILGPHIGDVPVAVPLMMAGILWPTYVCVNLLIDGKVMVDPRTRTWWENVWRCVLYGFVHSWYMFVFNGLCEQWGLYRWVGSSMDYSAADMAFGDPRAPIGWAIYVFVAMLIFTFVMIPLLGKDAVARARKSPLAWVDAAPVVFIAIMGIQVFLNPVNRSVGNVAMWTLGFFGLTVGLRFVGLMRAQRAAVTVPDTPKELSDEGAARDGV
ncbi:MULTISPECIES: hypothetical protein [Gordonia]|uniref:hypothetical protein n=1 Tax=Gordonia TaxID=2053 RepID=UPI00257B88FE|nr:MULTISPECIES: hypothetical protein [Gordonia]